MKSTTRLDSVVFQLTPTRTRCDLVIIANEKMEKIVSGLMNPFLAHLKTAQEQMAKGGYSIMLEPNPGSDATWFTKGTVERFVRFVSTPEVLERVNTIESEILQIEEAIAVQSNENLGLNTVEDHQTRHVESIEGSKAVSVADEEKAIVLYKPGTHPPESNGSTMQEENSKVKLLKVLETRKTVLQKEQGMAFARAVAAGFGVDHMEPLISFAECFGATRFLEACIRFMELWTEKHESGQWLEIEEAEAMSSRSDLSSMDASGIMLSNDTKKQKFSEAWPDSHGEFGLERHKANAADADMSSHQNGDKKPLMDPQLPLGHHEYFQGQFQHPMFPQWPVHSPAGAPPFFQGYPMQGMPYYQTYPGNGPFFTPPYPPPVEDPRFNAAQRMGQKRHSMDSKDSNTESEREMGVSNSKSSDGLDLETEGSQGRESCRKAGRLGKRQSGTVVIRNFNYITSQGQKLSGSESHSASDPESDKEAEDLQVDASDVKHKNSTRSSKRKGSRTKFNDTWDSYDKDETVYGQGTDGGHWQAFQNCLLRDDNENSRLVNEGMLAMEKEAQTRRRQNTAGGDPIVPHGRDSGEVQEGRMTEFDTISSKLTRMLKLEDEELILSKGELAGGGSRDGQVDVQLTEIEGGRQGFRRTSNDNFMIYGRENFSGVTNSLSNPLSGNGFEHAANNLDRNSSQNATDESFIVPLRANSADRVGTDSRMAIDISSELPSALQKTEDSFGRNKGQLSYEPNDLSLMPDRGSERETIGYDPTVDYEMLVHTKDVTVQNKNKEENVTKEGSKKSDKDKKSKVRRDGLEKRKIEAATRKGKPSKLSHLTEAQARAERLRAFKADLQKMKKENEEEEIRRLEALKRERQKRIAARGSSGPAPSPLPLQQTKSRLPMKLPSNAQKSKFSDSDPAPVSHPQRLPIRNASMGSNDSQKITKIRRLSSGGIGGNGLSRSVPSLPVQKKEIDGSTPESKSAMKTRRLSDPKTSKSCHVSSVKSRSAEPVSKPKLSNEPEIKKISAIMSLDRTKAATLPELKIRTSKGHSDMGQKKSAAKEATQKTNVNKPSIYSEATKLRSNDKTAHSNSGDDNTIIEKTVVMLEPEVPPIPVAHASEERIGTRKGPYDEDRAGAKTEVVSEYAAIRASVSPLNRDTSECHLDERPGLYKVSKDYGMEELPTVSSISVGNKPYQAPYARVSSLEGPCTSNLEFSKAPATSSEMGATSTETTKAYVSDFTTLNSSEKNPGAMERPRGKESAGFRKLLKFGKKNHSSTAAEHNVVSDKLSVDGSVPDDHDPTAASSEVHTLKNLLSQDETAKLVTTPQKVSRPFSLLSPFRSKSSGKKLAT